MTINGISYSSPKNINLQGVSSVKGSTLRFNRSSSTNPLDSTSYGLYLDTSGNLVWSSAGSSTILGAAGGAAVVPSFDQLYNNDKTMVVSGATFTIDGTHATNDVLTLTSSGAGSGDVIQITNVGTGNDIEGTSNTWSFTKAGDMTANMVVFAGDAGSNSLTLTAGDVLISDGSIALTDADNAASLSVTNDTATTASVFVFAGSGAFTGSTTTSFFTITPSGLTTGTAVYLPVAALTTGIGLHVVANAVTTGQAVLIASSVATTVLTTTGRLFKVDHTGNATGTGTIAEIASAAADETDVLKVTASAALTGGAFVVSASSLATGTAIEAADLDSLTTGYGLHIASSAIAIATTGRLLYVNHTGATSTSGVLAEFKTAATDETVVVKISTAAMVDGVGLSIVGTTGMTTGSLLRATTSTAGLVATNGVYSLRGTGTHTSTSNAGLLDVQSSGMVGTAANSTLVNFQATGAAQVDTTLLNVEASGFTTGYTGTMIRIKSPTTTGSGTVVAVIADGITSGGTAMSISTAALTTGDALVISNGTAATTTGSLLKVTAGGIGAVSADGIVSFAHTGIYTSTSVGFVNIISSGTTAGTTLSVTASAATTGIGVLVATAALTEGTALRLSAVEATLTTGKYFECYDGAANDFSIARYGATVIAGNAALTASLTLTKGDLVISDGVLRGAVTATITADTGSIQGGNPITRSFNEIAVSAVSGDAITLPLAAVGQFVLVTNHGAQSADVFPALGDAINEAAANSAKALAADASMLCYSYDATNWECLTMAR